MKSLPIQGLQCPFGVLLPIASGINGRERNIADPELAQGEEHIDGNRRSRVAVTKYINTLMVNVESPEKTFLLHCKQLPASINSQTVIQAVDDAIRMLQSDWPNFVLHLSDAVCYMTAAGCLLKQIYPRLFHATCTAHLLHNCTEKL